MLQNSSSHFQNNKSLHQIQEAEFERVSLPERH